ncbi:hypothetical protein D3C72_775150 [compost metagenome]
MFQFLPFRQKDIATYLMLVAFLVFWFCPSEQFFYPEKKLVQTERLLEIIIPSTGITCHHVFYIRFGRKEHQRYFRIIIPYLRSQREPVFVRHHHV